MVPVQSSHELESRVPCPKHTGPFYKGLSYHDHVHSIKSWDVCIFKFCDPFCFFLYFIQFQKAMCSYTHPHNKCRFTFTLDPVDNDSVIANHDFENPIYQTEDESEEDCEVPRELARLLEQEEKTIQPHEESIEVINLGSDEEKKEVKIGADLENRVKQRLIQMLQDYVEIFAWSCEDMPGLDTDIVVHRLPIKEGSTPLKQKLRRSRPDMSKKIKDEVEKQFNAGFLKVVSYPPWIANIVPVPKKDGKVRMCVDYRD